MLNMTDTPKASGRELSTAVAAARDCADRQAAIAGVPRGPGMPLVMLLLEKVSGSSRGSDSVFELRDLVAKEGCARHPHLHRATFGHVSSSYRDSCGCGNKCTHKMTTPVTLVQAASKNTFHLTRPPTMETQKDGESPVSPGRTAGRPTQGARMGNLTVRVNPPLVNRKGAVLGFLRATGCCPFASHSLVAPQRSR